MALKLLLVAVLLAGLTPPPLTPYEHLGRCGRSVVDATNQLRQENGLRPLKVDLRMHRISRQLALRMLQQGELRHHLPTLLALPHRPIGENVGYSADLYSLNAAWRDSPDHRANILDPDYRFIGPGCAWRSGRVWSNVVFGGPR